MKHKHALSRTFSICVGWPPVMQPELCMYHGYTFVAPFGKPPARCSTVCARGSSHGCWSAGVLLNAAHGVTTHATNRHAGPGCQGGWHGSDWNVPRRWVLLVWRCSSELTFLENAGFVYSTTHPSGDANIGLDWMEVVTQVSVTTNTENLMRSSRKPIKRNWNCSFSIKTYLHRLTIKISELQQH